jgi:hypothetical protein
LFGIEIGEKRVQSVNSWGDRVLSLVYRLRDVGGGQLTRYAFRLRPKREGRRSCG